MLIKITGPYTVLNCYTYLLLSEFLSRNRRDARVQYLKRSQVRDWLTSLILSSSSSLVLNLEVDVVINVWGRAYGLSHAFVGFMPFEEPHVQA